MNEELIKLLELCKLYFTDDEIEEVDEFIQVNENKLALETICAIFYEEKKSISHELQLNIKNIGLRMTISKKKWERLSIMQKP